MIIPKHWAESRHQQKIDGRQWTIRRFGWSEHSMEEARAMADQRVAEALKRVVAGETIQRREPKVPYNGADGVPIREEIVARDGDAIVTRNSYGALCLNTPDVLFADMDCPIGISFRSGCLIFVFMMLAAVAYGRHAGSLGIALGSMILSIFLALLVYGVVDRSIRKNPAAMKRRLWRRIERFARRHPDWHLRAYETPAGYRLLAMHATFDPAGIETARAFCQIVVDPVYARMCRNQRCFRARVSPKPWRIGISERLKPRTGVWPIDPEKLPLREAWVRDYEQRSTGHAACRFVARFGSDRIHPAAEAVRRWHDELSRADSQLPLA